MRVVRRFISLLVPIVVLDAGYSAHAQQPAPGETSGAPLAPLLVEAFNPETGALKLVYQTGCDATNNNIYFGNLDQASSLAWTGEVCDIGNGGNFAEFVPGAGSYFFVVVGNEGTTEGPYGEQSIGGTSTQRPPFTANTCGQIQDLSNVCTPNPAGLTCTSSFDCPGRQACVESPGGPPQCACLPPFDGGFCQQCAAGYAGPDCRECAPGFYSNAFQFSTGDYVPQDPTSPLTLLCRPDVTESCAGRTCSGHGTCVEFDRDAVCACDEGYAGEDCGECAPDYEPAPASGLCGLGDACREAKCGNHGFCEATPFGEITCNCDTGFGGVDCGGPDFSFTTTAERFSLYDGESAILEPVGGTPPYDWRVLEGPATVTPCAPGGPCTPGTAELKVVAPAGGIPELELIRVSLSDTTGHSAVDDFVALPPACLPLTGDIHSELMPFYRAMLKYMKARGIRAGSLAISKGGTQIGANGYGFRDAGLDADPYVNAGEGPGPLVQPSSPFRLASVSKPLAAGAVRGAATDAGVNITSTSLQDRAARWVQDATGFSLTGGAPTFDYNLLMPLTTDDRWADISILHLLNHHAGFYRDTVPLSTTGQPRWNQKMLPFTEDLDDPDELQSARWGASSADMAISGMYVVAALERKLDPRPTPENLIRFAAGTLLNYNPGGNTGNNDNYSNLGYILLGRVLEGLSGETYDPDEPGVPSGWGAFAPLVQDYLCEASGIQNGVFPGDAFSPWPLEPYYRDLDWQGDERRAWNMAEGSDKIRFNEGIQQWQFCQSGCPNNGAVWNDELNTPRAYGGVWLATANSAGGLVATAPALLKFARNHRVKIGAPNDGFASGIGAPLPAPGAHPISSDHGGSLDGTLTELWQMKGPRTNRLPLDGGSWKADPSAAVDLDDDGRVIISEPLVSSSCTLPSGVVVAALFNQRQDQRAPFSNDSSDSTSDPVKVYFRIKDFLAAAACEVDAEGWPMLSDGGPVLQAPCP